MSDRIKSNCRPPTQEEQEAFAREHPEYSSVVAADISFPLQPIEVDRHGVTRFVPNLIVQWLLDAGPFDMNQIARLPGISAAHHEQLAQLIGYSVCGFCDLSYVSDEAAEKALAISDELIGCDQDEEPSEQDEVQDAELRLRESIGSALRMFRNIKDLDVRRAIALDLAMALDVWDEKTGFFSRRYHQPLEQNTKNLDNACKQAVENYRREHAEE
jgi:hypothetical protein